jgi:GMP synthase (glutamine-hydrolysing)
VADPVLVVQHEDQCPPAWFGSWLEDAGCALDVRRPYAGDALPADLTGHAALLVLGGSMGATDDHPWLEPTRALVREAAATGVPALGICLGHQLAAVALGGWTDRNPLGQQLGLVPTGWCGEQDALMGALRPPRGVQWNDDLVLTPPDGTVVLAATPAGELQAARFAPTVWGIQLHPEADEHVVEPWAALDRGRYPDGRVDAAVAAIAAAHEELETSWRPLADAFARLALAGA